MNSRHTELAPNVHSSPDPSSGPLTDPRTCARTRSGTPIAIPLTMSIWTQTMTKIDAAARAAQGDYYATRSALGRFCTESLLEAANYALSGLTMSERAKFASSVIARKPMRPDRDWAVEALCCYVHAIRIREWAEQFEASCVAARAEFPAAYEALGEVL